MWLPTLLFTLFAVLSATGVYLIVVPRFGRLAALGGAAATVLFFVAIYAGVLHLIGPPGQAQ